MGGRRGSPFVRKGKQKLKRIKYTYPKLKRAIEEREVREEIEEMEEYEEIEIEREIPSKVKKPEKEG